VKLYIKEKTPAGKVYYPCVNEVVIDYPCKTATQAQNAGMLLFESLARGETYEGEDIDVGQKP